jgi:hypothetical protein
MKECANRKENLANCACTYTSCGKRGFCCECISSHRAAGELPGCLFTPEGEKTYDRSVKNYLSTMRR